jgi:hypothetical protein
MNMRIGLPTKNPSGVAKSFGDCLRYHNLVEMAPIFREILDNPEIIGLDKDFLKSKSVEHRESLIIGEYLLKLSVHLGRFASHYLKQGQWAFEPPDWFDQRHHTLDMEKQNKNSWLESIASVLRILPENGKLLDYCAGDAYLDYQFFRHMASEITCVDIDDSNEYKNYLIKKNSSVPNIEYIYEDVLTHNSKKNYYDVVLIRGAIEHFSLENQILLFKKIKLSLKENGWFCGDTPCSIQDENKIHPADESVAVTAGKAQGGNYAHENEWKDEQEAKELLSKHFDEVHTYSVYCNIDPRTTIFWRCR